MNILEITEMLKRMPDADLQTLTQNPSPDVPSWALLTETNRRNRTRQGAQAGTGAPPTVAQQLTRQIEQIEPTPTRIPQPGAQSQPSGLGSMAQSAPKGYAGGGIVAFGGGGEVRGYGEGGYVTKALRLGYKAKDEADAYAWLQQQIHLQDPYAPGVAAPAFPGKELVPRVNPEEAFRSGIPMAPSAEDVQRMTGRPAPIPQAAPPAATRQPPAAAAQQGLPQAAPVPGGAPAGLGSMRGAQIAMPEKPTLAADVNMATRPGELAAYMGEDEYGKALAADLAERRKQAAETKAGSRKQTLLDLGLGMMVEGGKSGATFLGSAGAAGIKALEGQRGREAELSAEEKAMRKEALGDLGREQTERRGYTIAALGEAKEVAKENRAALAKHADRVQDTVFKNAELKNAITGHLIQADTQLKSYELALKREDRQQVAADTAAMGRLVGMAQKDMEAAKDTPDYSAAKKVYEDLFSAYKSMLPAKPTDPAPGAKKGKVVADLTK